MVRAPPAGLVTDFLSERVTSGGDSQYFRLMIGLYRGLVVRLLREQGGRRFESS